MIFINGCEYHLPLSLVHFQNLKWILGFWCGIIGAGFRFEDRSYLILYLNCVQISSAFDSVQSNIRCWDSFYFSRLRKNESMIPDSASVNFSLNTLDTTQPLKKSQFVFPKESTFGLHKVSAMSSSHSLCLLWVRKVMTKQFRRPVCTITGPATSPLTGNMPVTSYKEIVADPITAALLDLSPGTQTERILPLRSVSVSNGLVVSIDFSAPSAASDGRSPSLLLNYTNEKLVELKPELKNAMKKKGRFSRSMVACWNSKPNSIVH